ncbi:MAG: S1 RNA-binding domain-containing protein, partial [Planctomycetota bacterium]|nr:S1 RNA-binding domain-containing protein [Planctomycetota bacterium]
GGAAVDSSSTSEAATANSEGDTAKDASEVAKASDSSVNDDLGNGLGSQEDAVSKPRVKIGSQREKTTEEVLMPKAVRDAQETTVPIAKEPEVVEEAVPVGPSVNDLGEQWEKEAAAVLEGKDVNELMDQAAAGAELDLPVNSRVKGTVTKIFGDGVFFLLKGQYDGVVPSKQFKKEPEPGTMTDVVIAGFNAEDSLYELTLPGAAISVGDWSSIEVGNLVEVRVTGSNTGGLECVLNNIRGFIPASQIDISRVDNLGEFVNQTMECVVTEANKKKKNLVLSRRAILEKELKERKQEILEQFEVGSVVEGKISKLREFGAFVNIGSGVEGLIHISKCSWHHIKHPNEVFEDGQEVSVRIERINKETGKIQLSHRDTVEHPWKRVSEKYPVESSVNGTISKVADFGAFVKLETGIEGLVHISEIAHERVKSVADALSEGQEIEVKVLSVDPDKQKMSLSIKALLPVPVKEDKKAEVQKDKEPPREMAVKKRNKPLRGGTGGGAGGDQFGLKW